MKNNNSSSAFNSYYDRYEKMILTPLKLQIRVLLSLKKFPKSTSSVIFD